MHYYIKIDMSVVHNATIACIERIKEFEKYSEAHLEVAATLRTTPKWYAIRKARKWLDMIDPTCKLWADWQILNEIRESRGTTAYVDGDMIKMLNKYRGEE